MFSLSSRLICGLRYECSDILTSSHVQAKNERIGIVCGLQQDGIIHFQVSFVISDLRQLRLQSGARSETNNAIVLDLRPRFFDTSTQQ